jgi:preprotein translocase subunit SecG
MTFLFYVSIFVFMLIAIVLCLVILVQESKSLGLGASFGGDPGESLFGTSTADVLKKFTAWLAVVFMVSCVLLSIWSASIGAQRIKSLPTSIEEVQK